MTHYWTFSTFINIYRMKKLDYYGRIDKEVIIGPSYWHTKFNLHLIAPFSCMFHRYMYCAYVHLSYVIRLVICFLVKCDILLLINFFQSTYPHTGRHCLPGSPWDKHSCRRPLCFGTQTVSSHSCLSSLYTHQHLKQCTNNNDVLNGSNSFS